MDASPSMRPARPQSVQELVAQAENFSFNGNIPLKHWARAAETLYQEATFALSDDDYGRAYMMLYRHSILVIKFLPSHPQFKDPESQKAFKPLSKRIGRVLEGLETLKPVIKDAHDEWQRMTPAPPLPPRGHPLHSASLPSYADFAARDPTLSGNAKILDAFEHQDLAVDLAQKELTRRDTVRNENKSAGRRGQSGFAADIDFQQEMAATRRIFTQSRDEKASDQHYRDPTSTFQPASSHYNYPSISRSQPVDYDRAQSPKPSSSSLAPGRPPKQHLPPPVPGKPSSPSLDGSFSRPPNVPQKITLADYQSLQPTTTSSNLPETQHHPPPKEATAAPPPLPTKERLTFKPGAYLENGDPIRSLFIPTALRKAFLDVAADNTRAGLEMCGMLCGAPINNALFIRCLLIPDQKCTSDTCETENESALFDYCMSEDLMILGWIHTHPTQTCFMSSRDLHTHAGYQVMMPESVAIVCAPKFTPSYGVFRLTHPPGLNHILDCTRTETFHQHSIDNLYREAEHPHGHVYESDKLPFYVHDLRTK